MTPTDDAVAPRLLTEYRRAGGAAETIHDIGNHINYSPSEIAVMAEWLTDLDQRWPGPETTARESARLSLVKGLGRKESRKTAAIPALISVFDHARPASSQTRWAAGNSLYSIPAGKEHFEQLAVIAADRAFGTDRQMVVDWLGKSRHPDAAAVALAQLDDETVAGHALDALSKLRAQGVREQVEPFLTSKYPWWRRNAERIIRYDQS